MTIVAQARVSYLEGVDGQWKEMDSNVVKAVSPEADAWIAFYRDHQFLQQTITTRSGQRLFPLVRASACNLDPLGIDTITIELSTVRSGQRADYTAVETAPNSGIFQLAQQLNNRYWSASVPPAQDQLDVMPGDVIQATTSACNGLTLSAELRLDSRGFVFEAGTGAPLAGVRIWLIDVTGEGNGGHAEGPASVFAADGVTPLSSTVVSDAEGGYTFPFLRVSTYRLMVAAPANYVYPSASETHRSTGWSGPFPVDAASYGGSFRVDTATDNAIIHLPLDPVPGALAVQKLASRTTVEIAETLEYTVSVKNIGQAELARLRLQDTLPVGFRYVAGSTRVDGRPAADPTGGVGPRLTWAIGTTLAGAAEHTVRYRVRVGTGALQGDGVNRAQAIAEGAAEVRSNVATAKVKVEAGVFSDRAIVMGTVFADCNANGLKDEGEPGVPGVRLWLEDGTSVTTDGVGRYSLYGLSPRTHVLKLDAVTLPAGTRPLAISQRHAGDGSSRFVDPRSGELQRADFALGGCSDALHAQIQARVQSARAQAAEITNSLRATLTPTATATAGQDLRALPASGRIGEPVSAEAAMPAAVPAAKPGVAAQSEASTELPRFLGVLDGQVLTAADSTLRVVGHLGAVMSLKVNGEPVGDDRVGERSQASDEQTETRTYVGLPLRAGENRLTLLEHDAFGQLRATRELTVRQAGKLARIVIEAPAKIDAGASTPVRLRLQDAQGLPVDGRLPVTLNLAPGRWATPDLDPRTPELQTFIEGGEATLQWQAPDVPGEARLQVASDGVVADARVAIVAALRPLMAVGVVDAAFNLRRLKSSQVQPAGSADGFEDQLRAFSDSDGSRADGRAALFLKGKVRGDALLTVAYDSDKSTRERLFRDIQPDAFYPVYGDASERGFDAQSTGRLYVRVDRGQSSLLYGDFTTQSDDPTRQLGVYQRSLNGLKQHLKIGDLTANVYASRDSTRQQIVELRADGTSGPFTLGGAMAVNSEKVEVLVRDRNQPALVLRTTPQARFSDYEIEPLTGRLLMRAPVPSLDADLNPVSIRVTYEVEQGGPAFWVAGADALWQATEALQLGGALVRDWNPLATMQMGSVNARLQLAERTVLSAEVARIERGETAEGTAAHAGDAERVALTHDGKDFKARVHAARSDVGFDNRSAQINGGRSEAGAQATYMVDERTRLTGEALASGDLANHTHRVGVLLGVERRLDNGAKLELGARHVQQRGATAGNVAADGSIVSQDSEQTTTTVRAKASMAVPGLPLATVFAEAEQDVRDSDKRLVAVGGDYQIAGRGRAYLRHELVSSLTGPYALDATQRRNTTVLGLDMGAGLGGGEGRVFSEYRGREAFSGRETEAAIGLRNQWLLRPGLRVNASLERVQSLAGGKGENQSAAVTGAVEYTADPRWKGSARLELRESAGSIGVLSTLGVAVKLDDRWTLLGKNVLAATLAHGTGPDRWQERLQLGTAYRDDANRFNALGRYEYKDERNGLTDAEARQAHILSVHAERQVGRGLEITGRYAAKHLVETVAGVRATTIAQLASGRLTMDVGERWDLGVNASVMGDARLRSRQTAVGAEVGYRVKDNMWASVGYNVRGFKDRDLSSDNATERGIYLRLRFKFDERLFAGLSS